jgi:hypothetical protein
MRTRSNKQFAEAPSTLEVICDLAYQEPNLMSRNQLRAIRDRLEQTEWDNPILTRLDAILESR